MGNVESVLMNYEAYEQMYNRMVQLEGKVLDYREEEAEREPDALVDWQSVRRGTTHNYGEKIFN